MGADRNKHCNTERIRERWLVSAKAWGHGGAMDKSGSSFGIVYLETFLPWMPYGASDGDSECGFSCRPISPLRPAWPRSVQAFSAQGECQTPSPEGASHLVSCSYNVPFKCLNEDVPQSQTDPSESHRHTGSPNSAQNKPVHTSCVLCHVPDLRDKFVMDQPRILSKCPILACWEKGNLL